MEPLTIHARNVNDAYRSAINYIKIHGDPRKSRAGDVLAVDYPVMTVYEKSAECVLWDANRDANPFFHLMESLWMLAGSCDISYLKHFSSHIDQFSEPYGAYGYRWRQWFDVDQLTAVVERLRKDPNTRRAVLGMWDPGSDLTHDGMDIPCNLCVVFRLREHGLDMTVYNRSNDIIFGCYGANAVHFSFLQRYVAWQLDVPVGRYYQVSNDWHAYTAVLDQKGTTDNALDLYVQDKAHPILFDVTADQVARFIADGPDCRVTNKSMARFMVDVAQPMRTAWSYWRAKNRGAAYASLAGCDTSIDWIMAAHRWMDRRALK